MGGRLVCADPVQKRALKVKARDESLSDFCNIK